MGGVERVQPLPGGQYDASLSWAREALYLNPNHLQVLAVRAAVGATRTSRGSGKGAEVLLGNFRLTVERHLRNSAGKACDIAHYRDGL
jgi:adenylate cyclase